MHAKFQPSRLNFIFINCYQLSPAVDSLYDKNLKGIFIYTLKFIYVPNFGSLGWFLFSSVFYSCHQLLTAFDSWWQLTWIKFDWNFHVHSIGDIFAKFRLSRLIFNFINFYQLLSAVDSCWQLMTADMNKIWLEFSCTLYRWYLCQISALLVDFYFHHILTAVISCWQLMTAVTQKNLMGFSYAP